MWYFMKRVHLNQIKSNWVKQSEKEDAVNKVDFGPIQILPHPLPQENYSSLVDIESLDTDASNWNKDAILNLSFSINLGCSWRRSFPTSVLYPWSLSDLQS